MMTLSRRSLLAASGGAAIASILRPVLVYATTSLEKTLIAAGGRVRITPELSADPGLVL